MAKSASANLLAHLQLEATTLTTIWTITRVDGTVVRLTELDRNITVNGNLHNATFGYSRTALSITEGLDADDIDITGLLDSTYVDGDDVAAGLYDGAELVIELVNYRAPEDGTMILKTGFLGEVILTGTGRYSAELRSLTGRLNQEIIEKTSPTCRAELGDSRCTVPIAPALRADSTAYAVGDFIRVATTAGTGDQVYEDRIYECTTAGTSAGSAPAYDTGVGNTTADGTAAFTAREAWTRDAVVATVTDNRQFTITITESRAVDDWFNQGSLTFQSGNNAGRTFEVKDWLNSTSGVTLFLAAPNTVQVGDVLSIVPGCDKLRATCVAKFALSGTTNFANGNVFNFRGEPDLPGRDAALSYPDAQ